MRFFIKVMLPAAGWLLSAAVQAQTLASAQPGRSLTQTGPSSTVQLRDALLQLRNHYKVDLAFEEQQLQGISVPVGWFHPKWSIEKNLETLLRTTDFQVKRLSNGAYLILSNSIRLYPARPTSSGRTDPSLSPGPAEKNGAIENVSSQNQPTATSSPAADIAVQGRVSAAGSNEGLPGVNVQVKGTTTGTTTDANGGFSLRVRDEQAVLVFSSIGYEAQEITVGKQQNLTVVLKPSERSLEEVVVVGYGTVKKSDLTGSVSSVSGTEFHKLPMATLDQGLQGRAAGVQVTQTDAAPGGTVSIRIRGGNSITNNNEPLYVVDGFPVTALKSLNPSDIESIEILKDASATAIYGSRGSNGVVLITTKQAKAGQSRLDAEYYTGVQKLIYKIPLLNGTQFAELANEAAAFRGRALPFADPKALGEGTDWQDGIYRTAPIRNYQLTFAQGLEKTRFMVSGNYFDQHGIIQNSNFKRLSFRFNMETKVNEKLKFGSNMQLSYINNHAVLVNSGGTGSNGVVHTALTSGPNLPIYDQNGNYFVDWQQIGPSVRRDNAVSLAKETTNLTRTGRILGNLYAQYELVKGLSARVSMGADVTYSKNNLYVPRTTYRAYFQNGIANISDQQTYNWLNENTLTYDKTVGVHHFNALAGFTVQREISEDVEAKGQNFVNDILTYNNLEAAGLVQPAASGANQWSLMSYLGRINYGFRERYLLTVSLRADGSSRFGASNKWGYFPSGALAWRVSEEPFMQNQRLVSDLKFRTSYGVTGFQEIPLYRSQSSLSNTSSIIGNALAIGIAPSRVANPDLKWERTAQFDVGVDFGVLNNRLRFTADYYYKRTKDLLLEVSVPWTSGYSTSLQNVGSTENKGFELSVSATPINGRLKWNVDANYSQNRNKVLSLGGVEEFFGPESGSSFYSPGPAILIRKGQPVNSFFGYVGDGLFRTQEDIAKGPVHRYMELGDLRFKDVNGDGTLSPADRTLIGNAQPKFIYGLNNTFTYGHFDLTILLQGVYGNNILNLLRVYELESMRGTHNNHIRALDRWTPENPNAYMPKADYRGQEQFISTRALEDGSYLRLRNIVLAYNLPGKLVKWSRSAKIYVSGQNILTWTNYTGYDPEVNSHGQNPINQGIDYGAYPRAKTFMIGVNLGL
ncbi:SusC/RagA family TonB-linked outer membrane protein [Larkinella bovis]|uniref:SusC/RagA family TonB-linked outer membrane protein n=1 Tax=Larkinella bovis TaxID=683041 RepID=A0ABW0IJX0_9BACT